MRAVSMAKPSIYVDTCPIIDAVKLGRGVSLSSVPAEQQARQQDCWFFRRLCEASRDGAIQLYTSTLTVAECLHVGEVGAPHEETQRLIEALLMSGQVFELIEADVFVAEDARDLRWVRGLNVKGADGIHMGIGARRTLR